MASGTMTTRPPPTPPHSTDGESRADYHLRPPGMHQGDTGEGIPHSAAQSAMMLHNTHNSDKRMTMMGTAHGYHTPEHGLSAAQMGHPPHVYADTLAHGMPAAVTGDGIMTRSGRSIVPPSSPLGVRSTAIEKPRVMKAARARRRSKPAKSDKAATPNITAPLSELTKHLVHIPIKDMEAWVGRSMDVRRREVAQKNGKIARPMNSFMLYRSAYAERTKEWCSQNNHQVVSRASGQSWPLEPPVIREKFELLANIERDNHQKAHPEYKFAPNKTQTPPRKKRSTTGDDSSDIEEAEFGVRPSPRPKRARTKSAEIDSCYESRESTPFDSQGSVLSDSFGQSPWQMNQHHLNRSVPAMMTPPQQTFYYPQNGVQAGMLRSHMEDGPFTKPGFSGAHYSSSATLAGIPGSSHHDLLHAYSGATTPPHIEDGQLDPQLLTVDGSAVDVSSQYGSCQYTLWQADHEFGGYMPVPANLTPNTVTFDVGLGHISGLQAMNDGHSSWSIGHDDGGEAGKEFEQWLTTNPSSY